jgi:hypothetical protein
VKNIDPARHCSSRLVQWSFARSSEGCGRSVGCRRDPWVVVVNMVVLKVTAELLVDKARLCDGCMSCETGW